MNVTRNGKIARLPHSARQELNRRLDEGEQGKKLVAWLNALPEAQAIVSAEFGGKPIREQDLSEWRQGGYRDWRRSRRRSKSPGGWGRQAHGIRSCRRSSAILKISPRAVSISCSREFSSRVGKAFRMASFLLSRAQMTKGKPNFSR